MQDKRGTARTGAPRDHAAPPFALSTALLFVAAVHLQRMGLAAPDKAPDSFVSIKASALPFWPGARFVIDRACFATPAAAIFAAPGPFFPALGQRFQVASVKRVGPALRSAIGASTPFLAVLLAVVFPGEVLNPLGALSIGLLRTGPLMAALSPKALRGGWPAGALLLPPGAALVRRIQQPISRVGLGIVGSPYFATLVMASVSAVVISLVRGASRQPAPLPDARCLSRGHDLRARRRVERVWHPVAEQCHRGQSGNARSPVASTTPLWTLLLGAMIFPTARLPPTRRLPRLSFRAQRCWSRASAETTPGTQSRERIPTVVRFLLEAGAARI